MWSAVEPRLMSGLEAKFAKLGTEHAPGQEVRQGEPLSGVALRGGPLPGVAVDFSDRKSVV